MGGEEIEGYTLVRILKKRCYGEVRLYKNNSSDELSLTKLYQMSFIKVEIQSQTMVVSPRTNSVLKSDYERIMREKEIFSKFQTLPDNFYFIVKEIPKSPILYTFMPYYKNEKIMRWVVQYHKYLTSWEAEFSETRARKIMGVILKQLRFLHDNYLIHGCIRPHHIYFTDNYSYQLLYFKDLRILLEDPIIDKDTVQHAFGVPESIGTDKYNGFKGDVYQLGVTLYALVCGNVPFYDKNIRNQNILIRTANLSFPKFLSLSLKQLLMKLLDRDPTKRISLNNIIDEKWFSSHQQSLNLVSVNKPIVNNNLQNTNPHFVGNTKNNTENKSQTRLKGKTNIDPPKSVPKKTVQKVNNFNFPRFLLRTIHWYMISKRKREYRSNLSIKYEPPKSLDNRLLIQDPILEGTIEIFNETAYIGCLSGYTTVRYLFSKSGLECINSSGKSVIKILFADIIDVLIISPLESGIVKILTSSQQYILRGTPSLASALNYTYIALKSMEE